MSEHYREAPARCPACAVPMIPRAAGEQSIDVCPDCAGVWVDWFDGEVPAVISQHAASVAPGETPRGALGAGGRAGARACPRCFREMPAQVFYPPGPLVFRCGECGGTFVPRASFAQLIAGFESPPVPGATVLARLRQLLHRLFGLDGG